MTAPYWSDDTVTLYLGDCRTVLPHVATESVDAIVTDPPYEYAFMGKDWDATGAAFDVVTWRRCLDVLKPGGWLLAFGGTRTYHRMVCAIEDAGFEIRDSLHWVYGSGFSKGINVSKAIDKAAGATREVVGASPFASRKPRGTWTGEVYGDEPGHQSGPVVTASATDDAKRWEGWNTTLKPAHEPIVLARKPFPGTVAATVLTHGTGALNIDGCRVGSPAPSVPQGLIKPGKSNNREMIGRNGEMFEGHAAGRWPTNVVLAHQPLLDDAGNIIGDACEHGCVPGCPVADMDAQSGMRTSGTGAVKRASAKGGTHSASIGAESRPEGAPMISYGDSGGASRYFPVFRYEAKAPASERPRGEDGTAHATVKPLALMRWLVRLVTQPGGVVLDPFLGSGTTAEACVIEGFRCVGIERAPDHLPLIKARLSKPIQPTFGDAS